MTLSVESKTFEFKLLAGMLTEEEVVSWADELILSMENPPIEIIDLALEKNKHSQLKILSKLGAGDDNEAFEIFCKDQASVLGKVDFFEVGNRLLSVHYSDPNGLDKQYRDFLVWLDDELDLVGNGVKGVKPAIQELREFLAKFG